MDQVPYPLNNYMSIAKASQLLEVSLDTIRRWEKKGLVKARRTENGHRMFEIEELKRLKSKLSGENSAPYRVLKATEKQAYEVVELFAGAGGLALGMHNAGLNCKLLVEIDKNAVATLKKNKPSWPVILDDIANVNFTDIKADVVAGGFPCQSFSYAGKKLGFEDTRGTLFFEYARAIKEIQPSVIVGENVRGLEKHDNGRTLSTMLQILDDLGYRVSHNT
jgi:DNA (cytosine-5)-methyltransferase 1